MPSQSAHLFFSYAHDDAARLTPIHAQMQNVLERNLWLDKVGLERGMAWNNAIKAAIDDSYGVIFAVTKTFVTRPFILEREIPWALDRFKDKQGVQLFPILFDDVELPELLKTPYITYPIKAFEMSFEAVLEELKKKLPTPEAGVLPFMVDWPRLANFKGRDNQLIELHQQLMGDGRQGVKTVGLHGTGGIGKTQLAVEYAHRYRYHYPGGVYWLNAGADWRKEVAACVVNLDRTLIEKSDEEKVLAFRDYLVAQGKDALLVLDNVNDPVDVARREIAPRLTIAKLCADTRTRLLFTTRVQKLPEGFEAVSVGVLKPENARAVLLEAWTGSERKDEPDARALEAIAQAVGHLPLALGWIAAALSQLPDTTPRELLDELKARGLDDLIRDLQAGEVDIGTPEYHDRLVSSVLDWQMQQLKSSDAPSLLALTAAFGEAAVVPLKRLWMLMRLPEKGVIKPFPKAVKDLQAYSLVETLTEGQAFRLHPLTRQYIMEKLDPSQWLNETVSNLVAAYRDPAILDNQTRTRGFAAVLEDLTSVQGLLSQSDEALDNLTRLLMLEEPHLLVLPQRVQVGYITQQLRERAHHEGNDDLKTACDSWLKGKLHWHHDGMRYPANRTFLRTVSGHTYQINGVLQLSDDRLLSWSDDHTLRLWKTDGSPEGELVGHSQWVRGALETRDKHILSWSFDGTLRLWSKEGNALTILQGHLKMVNGALQLRDGRILSWSQDHTLLLWSAQGDRLVSLEGHTSRVDGALQLRDGRILSWSWDATLRIWSEEGNLLAILIGHSREITGALQLKNSCLLSWSMDSTLRLWSIQGDAMTTFKGHTFTIEGVLQLSSGNILSWSDDNTLRVWSEEGNALAKLEEHTLHDHGALQLRDGRILLWSFDGILHIWSEEGNTLAKLEGHTKDVWGALELKDGRILSWSWDATLRIWSEEGNLLATLKGHTKDIKGALELKDGRILSWSKDHTFLLWSGESNLLSTPQGHTAKIVGISQLNNGCMLSWAEDNTLRLWSSEGNPLATLEGHTYQINGAIELRDSRLLSWAGDGTLHLWSVNGESQVPMRGHRARIHGAQQLKDGRILSWAWDDTLRLWSEEGNPLVTLKGHRSDLYGALQLSDTRLLSWSEDHTLRLWSVNGEALQVLEGHTAHIGGALQLRDGHILSWSNDHTLRLWNVNGEALQVLEGQASTVYGALQLKDDRLLSWAGDTLRLWSVNGEALQVLEGHTSTVYGALQLRDGRILSWSNDHTLRLWSVDGEALQVLEGQASTVYGALQLRDGRILSWSSEYDTNANTIYLWNTYGKVVAKYTGDAPITRCILNKDEMQVTIGDTQGHMLVLKLEEGDV